MVLHGAIMGALTGAVFLLHHAGMTVLSPDESAFLTSTYCVITPLAAWVWKRQAPRWQSWLASGLCALGVWLLFSRNSVEYFATGAWLTLASALLFAIQIVATASFVREEDPLALTVVQFLIAGAMGFAAFAITGGGSTIPAIDFVTLLQIIYLVAFSTLLATAMQNEGIERIAPWNAALLLAMEAPFAVAASLLAGYASLDAPTVLAFIAIGSAIVLGTKPQ